MTRNSRFAHVLRRGNGSGSGSGDPVCDVCERTLVGTYRRTPSGQRICGRHLACGRCLGYHREACADRREAVQTTADAVATASAVDRDLARRLGIRLPTVPLTVVDGLAHGELGRCMKGSVTAASGTRPRRSANIVVRPGLDRNVFAMVYIHEGTHALIHLSGMPAMTLATEEGLCEYVAWCYLSASGMSPLLAESIRNNPDPVYGGGMRMHLAAAEKVGHAAYLNRLPRPAISPRNTHLNV